MELLYTWINSDPEIIKRMSEEGDIVDYTYSHIQRGPVGLVF